MNPYILSIATVLILSDPDPEKTTLLNRAEEFCREEQYEDAATLLEKALNGDIQSPLQQKIRLRLSRLYLDLKRYADADAVFLNIYKGVKVDDPLVTLNVVKMTIESLIREGTPSAFTAALDTLNTTALFSDELYYLKGTLHYKLGNYPAAEEAFLTIAQKSSEALYWAAMSAEKQNKPKDQIRSYRLKLIEQFPQSSLAAEAYLLCYPYSDYLQGDRIAIKHLQGMPGRYPDSPFLLNAHTLIGLDYKRDRKTPEGKWIRKRNLTAAIDSFNEVESLYDKLDKEGKIPEESRYTFQFLRYRAMVERALANLAIANESLGAKREIYLEYAEEVFRGILYDLGEPGHLLADTSIPEEATHWLIHTYLEEGKDTEADATAVNFLEKYRKAKVTRGYYLSRLWYQRATVALRRGNAGVALEYYRNAEEAGRGKVLSIDQRLDLWIQQSAAHEAMGHLEEAMLLLSQVVNEDAISGLRLKAMYLRAELYEKQGRRELAKKQLEAMVKKGGEWSAKAKEKLKSEYGI